MKSAGVDAAADVDGMDAIVEPTWKCLRRFVEVSAHPPLGSDKQQWKREFQTQLPIPTQREAKSENVISLHSKANFQHKAES